MQLPSTFVIYDFETTGLDIATCNVIEIGARLVQDGVTQSEKSWLIKIKDPLPDKIVEITGITNALLAERGVDELQAFTEFRQMIGAHPLVGHNILRYDNPILLRKIKDLLKEDFEVKGCFDTAALFKAWQMELDVPVNASLQAFCLDVLNTFSPVKFRLSLAHEMLGFDSRGIIAHRALGDVEMVSRILPELAKKFPDPPVVSLDPISNELKSTHQERRIGETTSA